MALPHTFLTAAGIVGLWWGGHLWCVSQPSLQPTEKAPAFAIYRSAYGSMLARMMKDSLYSYWHEGKAPATAAEEGHDHDHDHGNSAPAGRLGNLHKPPAAPRAATGHEKESWLDHRVDDLARMEALRTKRNTPFQPSAAHRKYISASADWRLRLANQLDPGDPTLYEILNFNLTSQGLPEATLKPLLSELAHDAVYHALGERSGVNEALTGAGAAVNLLNDQLQRNQAKPADPYSILRNWQLLTLCLERYQTIHQDGIEEGWWSKIPEVRQEEIETYARLLQKIAETIRKQLVEMKLAS